MEKRRTFPDKARIVGIDEVGTGAWAGPIVLCSVLLEDASWGIDGLNDSKKMTPERREKMVERMGDVSHAFGVASAEEVDRFGAKAAYSLALMRCFQSLEQKYGPLGSTVIVFDGEPIRISGDRTVRFIPKADEMYPCVQAASIFAKVHRDRYMCNVAEHHPYWSFHTNSGYGTKQHMAAIQEHGLCEEHRQSVEPIQRYLSGRPSKQVALAQPQHGRGSRQTPAPSSTLENTMKMISPTELLSLVKDMNVTSSARQTAPCGIEYDANHFENNTLDVHTSDLSLRITKSEAHPGVIAYTVPGFGDPLIGILSTTEGLVDFCSLSLSRYRASPGASGRHGGAQNEMRQTLTALRETLLAIKDPGQKNKALFLFDRTRPYLLSRSPREIPELTINYEPAMSNNASLEFSYVSHQGDKGYNGIHLGKHSGTNSKAERVVWFPVASPLSDGKMVMYPYLAKGGQIFSIADATTKKLSAMRSKEMVLYELNRLAARVTTSNVPVQDHSRVTEFCEAITHTQENFEQLWELFTLPADEQHTYLHAALFQAATSLVEGGQEKLDPKHTHMTQLSVLREDFLKKKEEKDREKKAQLARVPESMNEVKPDHFGVDGFSLWMVPGLSEDGVPTRFLYRGNANGFDIRTREVVALRPCAEGFASKGSSSLTIDQFRSEVSLTLNGVNHGTEKVLCADPTWLTEELRSRAPSFDKEELETVVGQATRLSWFYGAFTTGTNLRHYTAQGPGVYSNQAYVMSDTRYDFKLPGLRNVRVAFKLGDQRMYIYFVADNGEGHYLDHAFPMSVGDMDRILDHIRNESPYKETAKQAYLTMAPTLAVAMRRALLLMEDQALEALNERASAINTRNALYNLKGALQVNLSQLEAYVNSLQPKLQQLIEEADRNFLQQVEKAIREQLPQGMQESTENVDKEEVAASTATDKETLTSDAPSDNNTTEGNNNMSDAPKTSTTARIVNQLKGEGEEAAYRVAVRQMTKLLVEPLSAAIAGPDATAETRNRIAEFLRSPMGMSFVQLAASAALTSSTKFAKVDSDVVSRISKELRITAMAEGADAMAEVVMAPLRQVMSMYLVNMQLPDMPEPAQLPSPSPSASETMGDHTHDNTNV